MGFRNQGTVPAAYEGLRECDAGVQQNCKCATTGRGAGGCVDISISEGSSNIPACASAEETAKLSHVRQLLYDNLRAGKAWKAHAQRNLPKQIIQTLCLWTLIPCTAKVAKESKTRVKVKTIVRDPDTTAKAKMNSQSNSGTLMGTVISVDTRNQIARARTNSSMARVTSVEHMGTRELTVLLKRWHTWNLNL